MHSKNLLILSGLLFAGFACQWAAWRLKLPSILLLLTAGIVAGPNLGVSIQTKYLVTYLSLLFHSR